MCATCAWLDLAAAITANLETRDRSTQATHILELARDQILAAQHVTDEQRDAIEIFADKEGWAVA